MGNWTLSSYDDVLRDKMKNMVMSSVKRARLEEGQPSITYEAFVKELDTCDSFTSSLVDILVKEVADRRTRPSAVDRRLISQSTADCLRTQAGTRHIYRSFTGLTGRSRRTYIQPVFSAPFSDEEDDTSEQILPEGIRINSDLYDAYHPLGMDLHVEVAQQSHVTRDSETPLEAVLSPRPRPSSPPLVTARRPIISSSTSLARQNSIRRSGRPRAADFSEFTSRRRSTGRQSREQNGDSVRPEESVDGTWRFSSTEEQLEAEDTSSSSTARRRPRRFFPLSAWSDPHLRIDADDRGARDPVLAPPPPPIFPPPESQSSSELWYSLTAGSPSLTSSTAPAFSAEGSAVLPRLRRGGIQAPESLRSRVPHTHIGVFIAEQEASMHENAAVDVEAPSAQVESSSREDASQLPTPRSVSPVTES